MKEFNELIEILETLLGPDGCPWDREQTLNSMKALLLEEAYEVIEAINLNENKKIEEELGDLLFNVLFMCRLGQKENKFSFSDVFKHIIAKLIRRHPHIFGEAKVENSEQVLKQWEEIKKTEQSHASALDSVPKDFPALARAQKIFKKIKKTSFNFNSNLQVSESDHYKNEEILGATLFDIVVKGTRQDLDAEQALRKFLAQIELKFRAWEKLKL